MLSKKFLVIWLWVKIIKYLCHLYERKRDISATKKLQLKKVINIIILRRVTNIIISNYDFQILLILNFGFIFKIVKTQFTSSHFLQEFILKPQAYGQNFAVSTAITLILCHTLLILSNIRKSFNQTKTFSSRDKNIYID